jgi:SprT protein
MMQLTLFGLFKRKLPEKLPALPDPELPPVSDLETRAKKLLQNAGCNSLAGMVQIRWNRRLKSTAGLASHRHSLVMLNPLLMQFGPDEIDKTMRHELAHLVAQSRAGRRRIQPHGEEWKQACADLGLPGEQRCHTLPLPRRTVTRKHIYRCEHCRTEVARVRPFRRRVACLSCCRKHNRGRYDERFRLVKKSAR